MSCATRTTRRRDRARDRGSAAADVARGVRRPAEGARPAAAAARRRAHPAAARRPHPALRAARPRQDDARDDRRARERPAAAALERSGDPARRRPRGAAVEPRRRARCSSSTRCTAWRARPRRCSTSRWRTSASTSWSARAPGDQHPARSRAVHPRGRDDALGAAAQPAPRSLRLHGAPRVLRARRARAGASSAPPRCSESSCPARRARRDRAPIARHAAHRQPAAARACATTRSSATAGRPTPRPSTPRSTCTTSTRSGSIASTARCSTRSCGAFRGGPVGLEHARRRGRRGARDDRVGRRALPRAHRLHGPDAARPDRDAGGVRAPGRPHRRVGAQIR